MVIQIRFGSQCWYTWSRILILFQNDLIQIRNKNADLDPANT